MAADGRVEAPAPTGGTAANNGWLWLNLFRSFQVALDPRKLFVAALGILVMSLGWWLLSVTFMAGYSRQPIRDDYAKEKLVGWGVKPPQEKPTDAEIDAFYEAEKERQYQRAVARYRTLEELAGEGGKLRTLPWNEFRGKNPYLFASDLSSSPSATWGGQILTYFSEQIPVLTEPLQKLLLPVLKLSDPNASTYTRIYLVLCLAWSIATWAFFGGVITRLAAVQFNGKERTTLKQAVKFVLSRYISYVLSPTFPLAVVAIIVLLMAVYGLVALIPIVGDVLLYGLLFPLIVFGGIAIAVILLGLIGYPLMYATISVEGSDTFDAVSRSYNYVFQAPWSFLWYSFVALVYGAAVSFVVILLGCVMVGLGKGAVSIPASAVYEPRKPDFMFVYAPESLGWKELLLRGTPLEVKYHPKPTDEQQAANKRELELAQKPHKDLPSGYQPTDPKQSDAYMKEMTWSNYAGAGIAWFWMVLVFLLMIGFTYSFFWTSATMIYLLMRKKVDEVEIDEVYIEETPPTPPIPPAPTTPVAPTAPSGPSGGTSLPVVPPPPVAPTPPPPASPPMVAEDTAPPSPPAAS